MVSPNEPTTRSAGPETWRIIGTNLLVLLVFFSCVIITALCHRIHRVDTHSIWQSSSAQRTTRTAAGDTTQGRTLTRGASCPSKPWHVAACFRMSETLVPWHFPVPRTGLGGSLTWFIPLCFGQPGYLTRGAIVTEIDRLP